MHIKNSNEAFRIDYKSYRIKYIQILNTNVMKFGVFIYLNEIIRIRN